MPGVTPGSWNIVEPGRVGPGVSDVKRIDLSYPTVVGGAVAAATAAALSTRLGLVGTVLGAGVASVISTVVATALSGWLEGLRGAVRRRDPIPFQGLLIGALAMGLVAAAFHTGLGLLTEDLSGSTMAARVLAQLADV